MCRAFLFGTQSVGKNKKRELEEHNNTERRKKRVLWHALRRLLQGRKKPKPNKKNRKGKVKHVRERARAHIWILKKHEPRSLDFTSEKKSPNSWDASEGDAATFQTRKTREAVRRTISTRLLSRGRGRRGV